MITTHTRAKNEVGGAFVQRHQADVIGVLHGWDRLRLQGTLRSLYYQPVMEEYLWQAGVLWKDFKRFATDLTGRVRQAAEKLAGRHQRPLIYLPSSRTRKEEVARQIQQRDKVGKGLIAVLSCVEPCRTWFLRGNRVTRKLEIKLQWGKCMHLYFYWMHEELGFLHLRLQTWFPFLIQVCLNGREWLGRQMDRARMSYRREQNCYPWVRDIGRAQALMDQQHQSEWCKLLGPLVKRCHPLHAEINAPIEQEYYWTAAETEYATDVMFRDREALKRIYPSLVHHAVMSFGAEQVFRFWGRPGRVGVSDEVMTDRRRGSDGVRVKHWVNKNSLKFYNKGAFCGWKQRLTNPESFAAFVLRRSVADFYLRAQVSRAATERHLTALASVHVQTPLKEQAATVCRPVRHKGQRYRALNPLGDSDAQMMTIVNRGEFSLNGFRNRDIRAHLYPASEDGRKERQQMAAVGRRLRLLRAHGLIAKVSKTHRYVVTEKGHNVLTALLAARQASTEQLTKLAA